MILLSLLSFLVGLMVGSGSFMLYGLYHVNRIKKIKTAMVEELKKRVSTSDLKRESIKERLIKASELAQLQMNLRAQVEMPSKNSLHSRHKNGIVGEIHELEHQKINLLKSILGDGFDPMITVVSESGGKEEISLSTYVAQAEVAINAVNPAEPTDLPPDSKKVGKFILYKGGKNDDGTTH